MEPRLLESDDNLEDMDSKLFFLSAIVNEDDLEAGLPMELMEERDEAKLEFSIALKSEIDVLVCISKSLICLKFPPPPLLLQASNTFLRLMASTLFFFKTLGSCSFLGFEVSAKDEIGDEVILGDLLEPRDS